MDLMREKTIEFRPSLLRGAGGGGSGPDQPDDNDFVCTDRFARWRLVITTDFYPDETSWTLTSTRGGAVADASTAASYSPSSTSASTSVPCT